MLLTNLIFLAQEAAQQGGNGVGGVEIGGGIGTLGFLTLLVDRIVRAIKSKNGNGGHKKTKAGLTTAELREQLRCEREADERERAINTFRVQVLDYLRDIRANQVSVKDMRKDVGLARDDRDEVYKEYYKILASLVPKLESLSDLEDRLKGG